MLNNISWLVGGSTLRKVLAFLMGIMVARYLGPDSYGLIGYAAAYTTFFSALCTLGINSVLVVELMERPQSQGETLGTALAMRAASSAVSAVIITGAVCLIDAGEPVTIAVVGLSSIGLVFSVYDTFNYWFQSRLQSKYCAIATNVSYLAVCAFQLALIVWGKSVVWFALATSLDYAVSAVVLFGAYRKLGGGFLSFSRQRGRALLRRSSPFILAGLMASVYASTDRLMLKQMVGDASVGYYALSCSLAVSWAFVLSAVIDSLYPSIVSAKEESVELYNRRNRQLYAAVFYVAAALSVAVSLVAEPLVSILYGAAYLPAVDPLRVVVWYTAFSYLGVARNAWMVCEGKQDRLKYLYASSAVLNVVLNALLIPLGEAVGAAAASLITQVFATVIMPALMPSLRGNARLMVDAVLLRDVLPERKGTGRKA